jgi:hypothetical protein
MLVSNNFDALQAATNRKHTHVVEFAKSLCVPNITEQCQLSVRFQAAWGSVRDILQSSLSAEVALTWLQIEQNCQIAASDQSVEEELNNLLEALAVAHNVSGVVVLQTESELMKTGGLVDVTNSKSREISVELSNEASQWLDHAEKQMALLFWKRLERLASGERNHTVSKRLSFSGSCPIFETKLDKGLRILWTKLLRETKYSILVRS